MITFGLQLGGPEQGGGRAETVWRQMAAIAAANRGPDYNDGRNAWVNPIFVVSGSIWRHDQEGLKVGRFSRKRKGLAILIFVPEALADSDGFVKFACSRLHEALELAAQTFAKKKSILLWTRLRK